MIDETFGDEDEVDASFYGRSGSSSKLLTSVPLGEYNNSQPAMALTSLASDRKLNFLSSLFFAL
jgi:hypothetical protein